MRYKTKESSLVPLLSLLIIIIIILSLYYTGIFPSSSGNSRIEVSNHISNNISNDNNDDNGNNRVDNSKFR